MKALASVPKLLFTLAGASTGAVGVAWIVSLFLRKKSAALRHLVWLLALLAPLLALPLGWAHTRIDLPVLPPSLSQAPIADITPDDRAEPPRALFPIGGDSVISSPLSSSPAWFDKSTLPFNLWTAAWLLGAAVVLARILISQGWVRHLVRNNCEPASADLTLRLNEAKHYFKFTRPVRLLVTPLTEIPFCCGIFRPTIIFPKNWIEWDEEKIDVCLTHEMAHIVRRDLLSMALAQTACVLCWFNPLVWYAAGKLRDEAEIAADDRVLSKNICPEAYAANLVALTEKYRASALAPTIALSMARPNRLKSRVESILDSSLFRKAPTFRVIFSTTLLATLALIAGVSIHLTAATVTAAATGSKKDLATLTPEQRDAIWNASFEAMKKGDSATIESFLNRGLDVNVDLVSSSSLLFNAVADRQLNIVKLLLAHGADVNQKTSWGDTPIQRACWIGAPEIAAALIKAGAKPDAFHYAVGMGDVSALEALDKKQPINPDQARDGLNFAVASGHTNTFDWLWARLAPMDATQKDKLLGDLYEDAGKWGQISILQHLESLGASPQKFGSRALVNAVCWNFPATVKYLLDKGVSPNDRPPHWGYMIRDAAGDGHLESVRLLLDHGTNMNVQDEQGNTPLNWAAYCGKEDICLLLLERGADGKIPDMWGRNAAWNAAGCLHAPAALEALIKKGVPVTGRDKNGETILNYMLSFPAPGANGPTFADRIYSPSDLEAYRQRESRIIDLLAATGLNLNGEEGSETPLMTALRGHHFDAARFLIARGVNLAIKDKEGSDALDYFFNWSGSNNQPLPLDILESLLKGSGDPHRELNLTGMNPPQAFPLLEEVIAFASNQSADVESFRKAIQILIAHGAVFPKVADDKVQTLLKAATRGDLPVIQKMIHDGVSINAADGNGWNALTIASALSYNDVSSWLIANGADVEGHNLQKFYGPLSFALQRGQTELVDQLIAKGAKVNSTFGSLYEAVQQNNQHMFDALIKAGISVKDTDYMITSTSNGVTYRYVDSVPLYLCIKNGNTSMAQTLLEKGQSAEPAHLDADRNLVYWAVFYDRLEILKMLLAHGANPSLKPTRGDTALELAKKSHPDLVPILEEAIKHSTSAESGKKAIERKIQSIVIDKVDLDKVDVADVIQFLTERSKDLDPEHVGINFVLNLEAQPSAKGTAPASSTAGSVQRAVTLHLENVPLADLLGYIIQQTHLQYAVDDYAVYLRPSLDQGQALTVRTFLAPPNFFTSPDKSPASPSDQPATDEKGASDAQQELARRGIRFPPGSMATFLKDSSKLVVRNTPEQLDLIANLIEQMGASSTKPQQGTNSITGVSQPFTLDPSKIPQVRVSLIITGKNLKDWAHLPYRWAKLDPPTVSRIDLGTTTISSGGTGAVTSSKVLPYPTDFDPAERLAPDSASGRPMPTIIPITPTAFKRTYVGWLIELKPIVEKGQIRLLGTATYTDAQMHQGIFGENAGPIYDYYPDLKTDKTSRVLLTANRGPIPFFKKSEAPFFVFCQPGHAYEVRLPYGSDWVTATITCDLQYLDVKPFQLGK